MEGSIGRSSSCPTCGGEREACGPRGRFSISISGPVPDGLKLAFFIFPLTTRPGSTVVSRDLEMQPVSAERQEIGCTSLRMRPPMPTRSPPTSCVHRDAGIPPIGAILGELWRKGTASSMPMQKICKKVPVSWLAEPVENGIGSSSRLKTVATEKEPGLRLLRSLDTKTSDPSALRG